MKIKNFIEKVEEVKHKNSLDISTEEDLNIALMNLVSLEEYSFFSYVKTQDDKFLKTLKIVGELKKKLLECCIK